MTHEHFAHPVATKVLEGPGVPGAALIIRRDPTTKEWCVWKRDETIGAFKYIEHAELFVNVLLATERLTT